MAPRLRNAWIRPLAVVSLSVLSLAPAWADGVQLASTAADVTDVEGEVTAPTEEYVAPETTQEDVNSWWLEYGKNVGNRYQVALNSLITAPADPVMDTVKPREEFEELPLADYGPKYVAGLGTGLMLSMYRATTGAFDVLFGWLPPMKMLSPEPRYMLLGGEHPEF